MGTAVFNSVNGSCDIEEGDLDVVELNELATARGQVFEEASFEPSLGFHPQ